MEGPQYSPVLPRKLPAQTPKLRVLQKLLHPYLQSIIHFVNQLSDADMQRLTVQESSKILPYALSNRKTIRAYLKVRMRSIRYDVRRRTPFRLSM